MALEFDYSKIVSHYINTASEEEFWEIVAKRLNIPLSSKYSEKDKTIVALPTEREYWTEEFLIDELFLQLAQTRAIIVNDKGKSVKIYKYYNQAFRLSKWIPIAKPTPEFVINQSDLTLRIIAELKTLSFEGSEDYKTDLLYVLTQAVGRIFEKIDARRYHESIAPRLKVRFEK